MSIATHVDMATTKTLVCDVVDVAGPRARLLPLAFRDLGGQKVFHGFIKTLQCFEDNALIKQTISAPGNGCVLVIDGGSSLNRALVGGNLAALAQQNGWAGLIVVGAVRDVAELEEVPLGIKALGVCPRSSEKAGTGALGRTLILDGHEVHEGHYLYADRDGIVILDAPL